MQCKLASCRAVSASNNRLVSLLGGTLFFGWLKCQFLSDVENSFTICGNSVVYQSAPVVDLCCRLFPVVNAVLLPVEGRPFVEHPLASSPWTRFHTNRLTQTITQFGSVFRNCFQCLLRRLTDVKCRWAHYIFTTTKLFPAFVVCKHNSIQRGILPKNWKCDFQSGSVQVVDFYEKNYNEVLVPIHFLTPLLCRLTWI